MSSRAPITLKVPNEIESAHRAGLHYRIPKGPRIERRRQGTGFIYVDAAGRRITDNSTLERIRSLVIPPAWTSVWISPDPDGHIQAVGRDARGRKQYRYHPRYRAFRDLIKFDRMSAFGKVLPRIRRTVARDLRSAGLGRRRVLAAVVSLLEATYIRVGNEEYATTNGSFGLTTLRNRHIKIFGDILEFHFAGKSAQKHDITIRDAQLARILRRCKDLPGSSLFEYLDENGQPQRIDSGDVNDYLREISGEDFTAKDFRTWGGNVSRHPISASELHNQKGSRLNQNMLVEVVKHVAIRLGNKPATCKKYYIHPLVAECYTLGNLQSLADEARKRSGKYVYEQIVLSLVTSKRRRTVSGSSTLSTNASPARYDSTSHAIPHHNSHHLITANSNGDRDRKRSARAVDDSR